MNTYDRIRMAMLQNDWERVAHLVYRRGCPVQQRLRPVVAFRVKVNGAGSFQMANQNSRCRHWERNVA